MAKGASKSAAEARECQEVAPVNTDELEHATAVAERRVLEIQAKLHRWARDDPHRRFDDLFNPVADPAFLLVAWDRVRGNKGAGTAGVDGLTAESIAVRTSASWTWSRRSSRGASSVRPACCGRPPPAPRRVRSCPLCSATWPCRSWTSTSPGHREDPRPPAGDGPRGGGTDCRTTGCPGTPTTGA